MPPSAANPTIQTVLVHFLASHVAPSWRSVIGRQRRRVRARRQPERALMRRNRRGIGTFASRTIYIKTRSRNEFLKKPREIRRRCAAAPSSPARFRCARGTRKPSSRTFRTAASMPLPPPWRSPARAGPTPRRRRRSERWSRRTPASPPSFPGCGRRPGARAGAGGSAGTRCRQCRAERRGFRPCSPTRCSEEALESPHGAPHGGPRHGRRDLSTWSRTRQDRRAEPDRI